jgi:hypothetical protein
MQHTTTIISTVRHNIGDDFVREGILYLLSSVGILDRVEVIHKHSPVTNVYQFERVRNRRHSQRIEPMLRAVRAPNRISRANLLVQSGAPVYWCHDSGSHCASNEWYDPLVRKRFLADRRARPFFNVAGGSCQRYHSDGNDACERCRAYMREFFDACNLTLLRDPIAQTMLRTAGRDAPVLPCTSIFARDQLNLKPERGEFIVLNFMENGGHYTFGQDIDAVNWRTQFLRLATAAAKRDRVVIACHTSEEERLARELVPELERFVVPNEHAAFMKFYARAKLGILNRVHGAFMMASFGKPAAVIGTDTRAKMVKLLGLPSYYVNDVESIGTDNLIEEVTARVGTYADESEAIRKTARQAYEQHLLSALDS